MNVAKTFFILAKAKLKNFFWGGGIEINSIEGIKFEQKF